MRFVIFALSCVALAAQSLSTERQAAIGRQVAGEINRRTVPVESVEVQNYLAQVGGRIAYQFVLPESTIKFTFSIVFTEEDNSLHEPLVVPGRYVFVPSRLLLTAADEAEFAGMLAQAIAREPFSIRIAQNNGESIPVFTFFGNFTSDTALSAGAVRQQREIEIEADKAAVPAMSLAGFDPAHSFALSNECSHPIHHDLRSLRVPRE